MKRVHLIALPALLAILLSSCMHRWVGRPVSVVEKQYGFPSSVRPDGDNMIYFYPDTLAKHGDMTFTVDRKGIVRSWCATSNVASVFDDDDFEIGTNGGFGASIRDSRRDTSVADARMRTPSTIKTTNREPSRRRNPSAPLASGQDCP